MEKARKSVAAAWRKAVAFRASLYYRAFENGGSVSKTRSGMA